MSENNSNPFNENVIDDSNQVEEDVKETEESTVESDLQKNMMN